jgi:hypothetical protein
VDVTPPDTLAWRPSVPRFVGSRLRRVTRACDGGWLHIGTPPQQLTDLQRDYVANRINEDTADMEM